MPKTTILARIPDSDPDSGCEYVVARVFPDGVTVGYSVAVRDIEADEYLPTCRVFPTLDRALEYADRNAKPAAVAAPVA